MVVLDLVLAEKPVNLARSDSEKSKSLFIRSTSVNLCSGKFSESEIKEAILRTVRDHGPMTRIIDIVLRQEVAYPFAIAKTYRSLKGKASDKYVMISTREERERFVLDLYNEGKSTRGIAQIAHMSFMRVTVVTEEKL